tara:strand:- start:3945 stop:4658 length:714 start_codon:yes stop_codon:yes gene_type:complete
MEIRPRLKGNKKIAYENITKKENRVLAIGDLHEPFCLDGYLEHCQETYAKYNCNRVVFIGDVVDNHYASFHEVDINAEYTGKTELDLAIKKISKWYNAFPKADVTIGNHDRLIMRKSQTSSIPKKWIKAYKEVLETPQWNFVDRVVIDDVQYIHGEAGTARSKCRADMQSTIQGHLHTQCYTEWYVGQNFKVFGCQIGCGIDANSYAMSYAKRGKKPAISAAVVLGGHTVINELMEL